MCLLKRLHSALWASEEPGYAQVVFDSLKDNPSYVDLILRPGSQKDPPWFLAWLPIFLETIIGEVTTYEEVLARMVDWLSEELQHERLADARPMIMSCAIQVSR